MILALNSLPVQRPPCEMASVVTRVDGRARREKVAVVGSGVAGLTAAYLLQRRFRRHALRSGGSARWSRPHASGGHSGCRIDPGRFGVHRLQRLDLPPAAKAPGRTGCRHAAGGHEHVGPLRRVRSRIRGRPRPGWAVRPPAFGGHPRLPQDAARDQAVSIAGLRRLSWTGTTGSPCARS
jgi:glycine/D-amino acid oxidase-like deaminating enzyme